MSHSFESISSYKSKPDLEELCHGELIGCGLDIPNSRRRVTAGIKVAGEMIFVKRSLICYILSKVDTTITGRIGLTPSQKKM